jgi:excisionase family DNA binding protein
MRKLLKVSEVAKRLDQHERTVWQKIATGELQAVRLGSTPQAPVRVDEAELTGWLAERRTRRSRTRAGGDHRF